jgi:hypothetical protein
MKDKRGITGTVADPGLILAAALNLAACSIVLAHNHPSGSLKPSRADEELTQKIKYAAQFHDIKVLDQSLFVPTAITVLQTRGCFSPFFYSVILPFSMYPNNKKNGLHSYRPELRKLTLKISLSKDRAALKRFKSFVKFCEVALPQNFPMNCSKFLQGFLW